MWNRRKTKCTVDPDAEAIRAALGSRSVVLIGLMGCGKSSVGRRLSLRLGLRFVDADDEIELAAGRTIPEIFADHGEGAFREGERKVIARLLRNGPQVLATGGGAFMSARTRKRIGDKGISVWLRAEIEVLMHRVLKRSNRPLLNTENPQAVMQALMEKRYPVYEQADIMVESRDAPHDIIVDDIIAGLKSNLTLDAPPSV